MRVKTYDVDFSKFDPVKHFEDYHYYEVYDDSKDYTSDRFANDYGHGQHVYEYYLHIFENRKGFSKKKKFIVAYEVLTENEEKELRKYCDCEYHKKSIFARVMIGINTDYTCVISYERYNPASIQRARDKMAENVSAPLLSINKTGSEYY